MREAMRNLGGVVLVLLLLVGDCPAAMAQLPPPAPATMPTGTAEKFRTLPQEQKIAALSALQFGQCVLAAPKFLDIDFTREIGVKRHITSTATEGRFVDSMTKGQFCTRAVSCRVTYPGNELALVPGGVQPLLRLRDKTVVIVPSGDHLKAELMIGNDAYIFWSGRTHLKTRGDAIVLELLKR
ncbi:MAG: hypothetical protein ABL898_01735 [Hyphomicrobiaceae bacterium]|nr:hypothetical protein [Hyphomicrobiaceae bacterium]